MLTPNRAVANPLILVVDDEVLVHRALERALSRAGCEYVGALDGGHGLDLARERKPDAILLDVGMPTDGRDILSLLKKDPDLCDVPVMMITGQVDANLRLAALQDGAHDVIEKPFDAVMLQRRIFWMIEKNRGGLI